jgi:hypothetical protein
MTRMTKLLPLLVATLLPGACSDDSTAPQLDKSLPKAEMTVGHDGATKTCSTAALMPADKAVGDYTRKAAPESANDVAALQAIVDGGSEKYSQNKFVCMSRAYYDSVAIGAEVELWVFDQTDAAGAQAAMDIAVSGLTDLTPVIGDASKEDLTVVGGYLAFARSKGRTLARVYANKKTARDDAVALLKLVLTAAP